MNKINKSSIIILLITFVLLEGTMRLLTREKAPGYEYLLGKPWRYVLPFQPEYPDSDTSSIGKYRAYHPLLGWDIGKSGKAEPLYFSDERGIRCTQENYFSATEGSKYTFDIICIGNSFTHGDAVLLEDTWTYQLEQISGRSVLNLGVGGYGIDQAVLKLKEKFDEGYHADTVILGLIAGDLDRALFTVYNFYIGGNKTKPKFCFEGDTFRIINQPCLVNEALRQEYNQYRDSELFANNPGFSNMVFDKSFWDNLYFVRILKSTLHQRINRQTPVYRQDDERLEYCMKILDYLNTICRTKNTKLVVLLLGNNNTFKDRELIDNPWSVFEAKLRARNISFFNADNEQYPIYKQQKEKIIHPTEGVHYSDEGHIILARILYEKLF